jgi:hypothetical protein
LTKTKSDMRIVEINETKLFKVGDLAVFGEPNPSKNKDVHIVTEVNPGDKPNMNLDKMTIVDLSWENIGKTTTFVYQHFFVKFSGTIKITQ